MPLEIKELNIVVTVGSREPRQSRVPGSRGEQVNEDKIIAKCVEQVLDILKQKSER